VARNLNMYFDTLYSAFEMIASGITTVQHIHGWMPGKLAEVDGRADEVIRAYEDVGMRVSYSCAVRDQNKRRGTGGSAVGDRGGARWGVPRRGCTDRRDGPSDARDWVIRFNAHGPEGLINTPSPGVPPKLEAEHRALLSRVVEEGPIPAVHGVVRRRACDLIALLQEEFGISVSDDTVYRALKASGFSHLSAWPKAYRQDPAAMEAFKKLPAHVAQVRQRLTPGTPVEVWFQML
jgi:transposase